jgi:hypothetical protein
VRFVVRSFRAQKHDERIGAYSSMLGNLAPTAYHEATQEYFAPPVGTSEPDTPTLGREVVRCSKATAVTVQYI